MCVLRKTTVSIKLRGELPLSVHAKLLQSCPTLCTSMDCRFLCPWESPGKNTGMGCHILLQGAFPTLEWIYISYVSCTAGGPFTTSATHLGLPFSKLVYTVKNLFLWSILLLSNLSLKMFGFISSEFYLKWTTAMVQSAGKYFQNIIDIKCTLMNQDSCHRFTGK